MTDIHEPAFAMLSVSRFAAGQPRFHFGNERVEVVQAGNRLNQARETHARVFGGLSETRYLPRAPREGAEVNDSIKLLDVVALTDDVPAHGRRGQVGTVVETLGDDAFEVEFSDEEGETYALLPLPAARLRVLHYAPVKAA